MLYVVEKLDRRSEFSVKRAIALFGQTGDSLLSGKRRSLLDMNILRNCVSLVGNAANAIALTKLSTYNHIGKNMSDNNSKVSYQKLQRLLADGEWEKADIETRTILLDIVKRRQWLRKQDIPKLPGLDLVTCDRLWFQYSKGHFGFGVQAKILAEQKNFEDFATAIGWSVKNEIGGRAA